MILFIFFPMQYFAQTDKGSTAEETEQRANIEVIKAIDKEGPGRVYRTIDLQSSPAQSLAITETLNRQAGIRANEYGGTGSRSEISIRGANTSQTGIYIEGIPLNSAYGGAVNTGDIPVQLFSEARVYKSYSPLYLSGSHIGGAIDLSLPEPSRQSDQWLIKTGITSLYSTYLGAGLSQPGSLYYLQLSGSLNRYQYLNNNGTFFFNTEDDYLTERKNEDFTQADFFSVFSGRLSRSTVVTSLRASAKEQGLPGVTGFETSNVRLQTSNTETSVAMKTPFLSDWLLETVLDFAWRGSVLNDPGYELAAGFESQTRNSLSSRLALKPQWYFSEHLKIDFLTSIAYNRMWLDENKLADRSELTAGSGFDFYFIDKLFLWQSMLKTQLSQDSIYLNNLKPYYPTENHNRSINTSAMSRLNLNVHNTGISEQLLSPAAAQIFVSVAHNNRPPSIYEKFGDGGLILPAPQLKNETADTISTGFFIADSNGNISFDVNAAYFFTEMNNLIMLHSNSQKTMIALNSSRARIQGIELESRTSYKHYLDITLNYTLLDAVDKSRVSAYHNKYLPYRPRHQLFAKIEAGSRYLRFFIETGWQGAVYRDRYNSYYFYMPGRIRVNTGVVYYFNNFKTHAMTLIIKNLNNNRDSDVVGYPLPGRTLELHYQYRWS